MVSKSHDKILNLKFKQFLSTNKKTKGFSYWYYNY